MNSLSLKFAPLTAILLLTALHAQTPQTADQANALKAQAEHFRIVRERGEKAYYQPRFDLSALPHYQPEKVLAG
ncbi:MAG: hypothetical protein WCJ10_03560, partial [Opitutaceae bacterium]